MAHSRRDFVKGLSSIGIASVAGASPVEPEFAPEASTSEKLQLHPLSPVPSHRVTIADEFWSPKLKVWQEVTIRDCFQKFENDRGGALNNFDKVRDGQKSGHAGPPWYDGLIYEAAAAVIERPKYPYLRPH